MNPTAMTPAATPTGSGQNPAEPGTAGMDPRMADSHAAFPVCKLTPSATGRRGPLLRNVRA